MNSAKNDDASSGIVRILTDKSTSYEFVSLEITLRFIGSWIKSFKEIIFSKQRCTVKI